MDRTVYSFSTLKAKVFIHTFFNTVTNQGKAIR